MLVGSRNHFARKGHGKRPISFKKKRRSRRIGISRLIRHFCRNGDDLIAGTEDAGAFDDNQFATRQVVALDFDAQAVVETGLNFEAFDGPLCGIAGGVGNDEDLHLVAGADQS